ncbi:hypothetical protein FJ976_05840 [Mesorhizobium sp. B1-1-9]|uniref:Uncharacterized protein n=1 Tax=Mesorhizobium opportunistum (strain LMG 24607 / HAMBI 3007 / WSM2075) TaxID=536019 RepID=F7Y7M8_MESOW|nr:conserved hypothetical protein [Mesorhizobium opportunistum WSM2075]TPN51572.1 hypothetical protein FJ978_13210 [Mesorhizobium sp. B1-1-7]TPN56716.1 hypothetical protein FJ976_05840 [Mesorhizobium sp. B1-1-9]
MTGKAPPTPPGNQSPKGPGDPKQAPLDQKSKGGSPVQDPEKRGHQGNTRVNVTPQRSQQDR